MRSTRCVGATVLLLATGIPLSLAAQNAAPAPVSLGAALDSATAAQIAAIADGARARGLPAEPIIAKARLGALRHAPGATIVAAARAVAERLALARTALGPQAQPADLAAGADALSSGVNTDALRTIHATAGGAPVSVPLGVLAELVSSGVPLSRAVAIVTDLIRRGAPASLLVALGNDVDADVRAGERGEASLGVRVQQLEAVLPAPAPASVTSPVTSGTGPKRR